MAERGAVRGPPPSVGQGPPGPTPQTFGVLTTPNPQPLPPPTPTFLRDPPPTPPNAPPGARPLRMNLYATWEVDRSSPSCVPRLFSLTLQRLALVGEVGKDLASVVIAVKLQGSKRVLRSNEIPLPPGGPPEAELQVTFSLQYPHFLKRDSNQLQLLLQRRKRYKNRAFPGYKTLAVGVINMAEVLQQPSEGGLALVLHRALKEAPEPVAEVRLHSLCSQPIATHAKGKLSDRSPDLDNDSEEEEEQELSFSSEGSDGQDLFDEEEEMPKGKKMRRKLVVGTRQPKLKQKFVALLKRFRVPEEAGFGLVPVSPGHMRAVAEDLDALYETLEISNPSDSNEDPEDPESLHSAPKPHLRPFFEGLSQSSSQTEMGTEGTTQAELGARGGRRPPEGGGQELEGQDPEAELGVGVPEKLKPSTQSPPQGSQSPESERSPERGLSAQGQRRALWEQLGLALGPEPGLPESLFLVGTSDWQGQWVGELLRAQGHPVVGTAGGAELQAVLGTILGRIQRLCSCSPLPLRALKLVALGAPWHHSSLLRAFARQMGAKGPDWQSCLRFLVVPLGPHPLAQYLASLDARYGATFQDQPWRDLFGRSEPPATEPFNVIGRILSYVGGANATQLLPLAEAMLTSSSKFPDEDSQQKFVPFVGVVKVGLVEDPPTVPGDPEDLPPLSLAVPSASPPGGPGGASGGTPPRDVTAATPPASPSMAQGSSGDALGLQVDYWVGGAAPMGAKSTLRGTFRSLQVTRLPPPGDPPSATLGATLTMTLVTREKGKKVPTLFKRPREPDSKSLVVEGITRLICSPRQPPALLTVTVDGTQWEGIKFFQLASQWPSHVKHFPVGIFGTKAP